MKNYMSLLSIEQPDEIMSRWLLDWYKHHWMVLKFFRENGGKLLYFDIDNDNIETLIEFLRPDFRLDERKYRHEYKTDVNWVIRLKRHPRSMLGQVWPNLKKTLRGKTNRS